MKYQLCPHYPYYYRSFLCHRNSTKKIQVFYSSRDSTNLIAKIKSQVQRKNGQDLVDGDIVHLLFQISVAILTAQVTLGLVNNDVKADNVLCNSINQDTTLQYFIR